MVTVSPAGSDEEIPPAGIYSITLDDQIKFFVTGEAIKVTTQGRGWRTDAVSSKLPVALHVFKTNSRLWGHKKHG